MAPKREAVDDDPVIATYDVFITPELQQQLYLVQFPNREKEKPYSEQRHIKPLQMRIKPRSGFVEVDVPISTRGRYDKVKGKAWKEAVVTARSEGSHGHGLASGFVNPSVAQQSSVVKATPTANSGARGNDQEEPGLTHQTFGGQISSGDTGRPVYMIGTFRGPQLHLSKLDATVQMRPQFHHIDAKTLVDRNRAKRDKETTEAAKPAEPRMVQQTAKSADASAADPNNAKLLLQAAYEEQWTHLDFRDAEEQKAYDLYDKNLFYNQVEDPPRLSSSLDNASYLEKMSTPRIDSKGKTRPKPLNKKPKVQVDISDDNGSEGGHRT